MQQRYQDPDDLTHKQWAWEFLRRNADYREAFREISKLSTAQQRALHWLERPFNSVYDGELFGSVHTQFLEEPSSKIARWGEALLNELESDFPQSEDDYSEYRLNMRLRLKPKFSRLTYCVSGWKDPTETPISKEDAEQLWTFSPSTLAAVYEIRKLKVPSHSFIGEAEHVPVPLPEQVALVDSQFLRTETSLLKRPAVQRTSLALPALPEVQMTFDLNKPIEMQIRYAKRFLDEQRKTLIDAGVLIDPRSRLPKKSLYPIYLDLLDGLDQFPDAAALADSRIDLADMDWDHKRRTKLDQITTAKALRDFDFLIPAFL